MNETLLAVLLGGVLTFTGGAFVEVIRNFSSARRERAARDAARKDRLDEIQRVNLLELQERLTEWMRCQAKIALECEQQFQDNGELGLLPEALDAEWLDTGRRLLYLTERGKDDSLRNRLSLLRKRASEHTVARVVDPTVNNKTIDDQQREMATLFDSAATGLGLVLRSYL